MDIKYILNQFGINETPISATKITSGHINSTFLAELINRKIVIQSLNRDIFKNCADIMYNIRIINNIFENNERARAYIDSLYYSEAKNIMICSATFGNTTAPLICCSA